jgi:hypothetical protein
MRVVVKKLKDDVSPDGLERLSVTQELIREQGSGDGVQPDHGALLTLHAHGHQCRQTTDAGHPVGVSCPLRARPVGG